MKKRFKKVTSLLIIFSIIIGQLSIASVSYASSNDPLNNAEIKEIVSENSSELSGFLDGILGKIDLSGLVTKMIEKLIGDIDPKEAVKYLADAVKDSIDKAISETIKTVGKTITDSIVGTVDSIGKNVADTIKHGIDRVIDTGIDKIADNIGKTLEGIFSGPIEGIIGGSGRGIGKAIEGIIGSIKNVSGKNTLSSNENSINIVTDFNELQLTLNNANEEFEALKLEVDNDNSLSSEDKEIVNKAIDSAKELITESNTAIDDSLKENEKEIDEIDKTIKELDSVEETDTETKLEVKRVSGKNRIETAIKAAENAYPEGSKNIILVSGSTFADALAANSLVNKYDAPILLTDFNVLATEVSDYLDKYKVENVFIIGGTNSISENIVKTIEDKNIKTKRISGDNRFDTSLEILKLNISEDTKSNIIIASGDNKKFADALAASSVSANDGTSIVLTNGTTLDENIINYINENKSSIENVYIVGGTNSVKDSVTDNIDFEATRVSGSNRVATSLEIANTFFKENKNVVLADGRNFPDALAAGGLSKKDKAPIILNDSDVINKEIINFVDTNEIENITIIGGMYSVPNYPSK